MQNNIENVLTKRNIMKQLISIITSCYLAYCKMSCLLSLKYVRILFICKTYLNAFFVAFSWSDRKKVKKTRQVCQFQSGKINGSQGFQFGKQCLAATIHRALEFKSLMQTDLFGGMSLHCKWLNTPGIHIIEIAVKFDGNFFLWKIFSKWNIQLST